MHHVLILLFLYKSLFLYMWGISECCSLSSLRFSYLCLMPLNSSLDETIELVIFFQEYFSEGIILLISNWSNLANQVFWNKVYCSVIHSIQFDGSRSHSVSTQLQFHHVLLGTEGFFQFNHHTLWAQCSASLTAWCNYQLINKNKAYKTLWKRQTLFHCCYIISWFN